MAYENIINDDARETNIEWLVMGETEFIPKEGDWSAANQRPITLLNTCYKWLTSVLKEKIKNTWQNLICSNVTRGEAEGARAWE